MKNSFFKNKICDICGEQATVCRMIERKLYYLCGSNKCNHITETKHYGLNVRKNIGV